MQHKIEPEGMKRLTIGMTGYQTVGTQSHHDGLLSKKTSIPDFMKKTGPVLVMDSNCNCSKRPVKI